jgi:F420-dependent oxidoreductase-like protein
VTLTANSFVPMIEGQEGSNYADLLRVAQTAERLGYGGFFRSDHWLPISGARTLGATDAWATLAGLARDTKRIRLGTLVSPMTFRHPSELAKQAATIDDMSGGRVEVGFGAGWYEGEHAAYGIPFPPMKERFDRLEEALEVCTQLWSPSDEVTYSGKHYTLSNAPGYPKPVQNQMPVIIGGKGAKRTPALTARFASEFNTGGNLEDWTERAQRARAACEAIGRDPETLALSWHAFTIVGATEAEAWDVAEARFKQSGRSGSVKAWVEERAPQGMLFGSAEQAAEQILARAKAGCKRFHLQIVPSPSDAYLEMFASSIIPLVTG